MLKNILNNFTKNIVTDYLMFFIAFFIVLSGPKLPKIFKDLFRNKFFKVIFLIIIIYKSKTNKKLSIMLTLFYLVIIDRVNMDDNIEKFSNRFPFLVKEKFSTKKYPFIKNVFMSDFVCTATKQPAEYSEGYLRLYVNKS